MRKIIPILLLLFLKFTNTSAQNILIGASGNISFNQSEITISEAGEDYSSTIEALNSLYINVVYNDDWNKRGNSPMNKWKIEIYKSDLSWHPDLMLETKRTGEGNQLDRRGNPYVQDGENYQHITNNPAYFFKGRGEFENIPVNFRISGASLTMGSETFETSVIFTVYDDW
jgi:hypothetical protein